MNPHVLLLDGCRSVCLNFFKGPKVALPPQYIIGQDLGGLLIGLSMVGKMAISASYGILYIFSAELYPTTVRYQGFAARQTNFANLVFLDVNKQQTSQPSPLIGPGAFLRVIKTKKDIITMVLKTYLDCEVFFGLPNYNQENATSTPIFEPF